MMYCINKQVTELKSHATTMWELGSGQSNGDRDRAVDRCYKNGLAMSTDIVETGWRRNKCYEMVEDGDKLLSRTAL